MSRFAQTILLFALLAHASVAVASELRLEASRVEVRTGDEFVIEAVLHADESVNAIEGGLVFPVDALEVKEIRDGNSAINFWVEAPRLASPGTIVFSGITPGGLSGVNHRIFSVVFEAKTAAAASIAISDAKLLRNDGIGTEDSLTLRDAVVTIEAGDTNAQREDLTDDVPPESFTPIITRDPLLFDDKWFMVFATEDKNSGVSHYQVKEYRFGPLALFVPWKTVESPYLLSDQERKSYIVLRAVDASGNIRLAEVSPTMPLPWYAYALYWLILVGAVCGTVRLLAMLWNKNI